MTYRFVGLAVAIGFAACAEIAPVDRDLCGNLIIEEGEVCDGDDALGTCRPPGDVDACQYDCKAGTCPEALLCGSRDICWPPNVCGNGVPEEGEDCDGPSAPFSCREAGQVGECHFDCTAGACPDGFKCLESGLCDDVDVCGNGVTEPSNGEDCDGSPEGFVCSAPNTPNACRFACDSDQPCPDGFGCGLDGLCRRHSGTFSEIAQIPGESEAILGAELDGDGRGDLVQVSRDAFRTLRVGDDGEAQIGVVATSTAPPRVGDVDGDGIDDIVFRVRSKFIATAGELAVLASDNTGSLTSLTHATENLPGVVFSVDAIEHATVTDMVMLDGNNIQGYSFNTRTDPGNDDNIVFGTTALLDTFAPPSTGLVGLAAAYVETAPFCELAGMAYRNDPDVQILRPCNGGFSFQFPPWNTANALTTLFLPVDHRPWTTSVADMNQGGAVFFGEFDGDGNRDIVVPTVTDSLPTCGSVDCVDLGCFDNGSCDIGLPAGMNDDCVCTDCYGTPECAPCFPDGVCSPIGEGCNCSDCAGHPRCAEGDSYQVGYGLGDGTFDSFAFPFAPGNQASSALPFNTVHNFQCPLASAVGLLGAPTLAVAELNDDVISDFVTGLGIYVSTNFQEWSFVHCPDERWVEAVVRDFDGNGTLDVLASPGGTTLDLLIGQGDGSFTPLVIGSGGVAVRSLVAADFDGNGVEDVAYIVYPNVDPAPTDPGVVMVSFGRQGEPLSAPRPVTRVSGEARLVAGRFLLQDGAADLALLQPGRPVAFLRGSATKQFLSTFVFRETEPAPYATFTGVKSFEAVALGNFAVADTAPAGTTTPIAALTTAADGSEHRMDLVSIAVGTGLTEVRSPAPFDCPAGAACGFWRLAAADWLDDQLDRDGVVAFRDGDLVVFDQAAPPSEVARFTTGINLYRGRSEIHGAVVGRPQVRDLDGDGVDDVALLGNDGKLTIFWGDGTLGATAPATTEVVSAGAPFTAFTFADVDPSVAGVELVTTGDEVAMHTMTGDRTFGVSTGLLDADGVAIAPGDALVAGDFDGDGLDDLAIGSQLSLRILRGVPALGGAQ